eukprot:PhF_6_TR40374/c0_g1_i1/m.60116/K10752/RBBP4, HAT2, CAF1, MIS16; histone-binding protein RBBP4
MDTYDKYQSWKCNAPLLYDSISSHLLPFPSLTVEWLNSSLSSTIMSNERDSSSMNVIPTPPGMSKHKIVYGTNAPDGFNEVIIGEVTLPSPSPSGSISNNNVVYDDMSDVRLLPLQRYPHPGCVNRCRVNPKDANLMATMSSQGFPCLIHRSAPSPVSKLLGAHRLEGFGLTWSPIYPHTFITGADDGLVVKWDASVISAATTATTQQQHTVLHHQMGSQGEGDVPITDVNCHPSHPDVIGVGLEDGLGRILDSRQAKSTLCVRPSSGGGGGKVSPCNSLQFSLHSDLLFATAGGTSVALWDLRNTTSELHSFHGHTGEVMGVQWSPFNEGILCSYGSDQTVMVWDLAKAFSTSSAISLPGGGRKYTTATTVSPELLFVHQGHVGRVAEVSFCPTKGMEWYLASVGDDQTLQVWQMAEYIYFNAEHNKDLAAQT